MREVLNEIHPDRIFISSVDYFVDCRDELPNVTKEKKPNDGQRNSGQSTFSPSAHWTVASS